MTSSTQAPRRAARSERGTRWLTPAPPRPARAAQLCMRGVCSVTVLLRQCELCVACRYNVLKMARHLFEWSGNASLADFYERAILNGILGNQCV